jgi:hypothetical protein
MCRHVNKHGDVQVKRVGRLASIDKWQPHSFLWVMYDLKFAKTLPILQIRLNINKIVDC